MSHDDESALQRRRQAETWGELDRTPSARGGESDVLVCKTTVITTYPTSAAAYYAVVACDVGGTEQEGQAGTITPNKGAFLALNLGSQVPPQGTTVHCTRPGARWVFRYCG